MKWRHWMAIVDLLLAALAAWLTQRMVRGGAFESAEGWLDVILVASAAVLFALGAVGLWMRKPRLAACAEAASAVGVVVALVLIVTGSQSLEAGVVIALGIMLAAIFALIWYANWSARDNLFFDFD
jgi:hypothetical protein